MSTVKLSLIVFSIFLISSCANNSFNQEDIQSTTDKCLQTRAAIDIGSGTTKLIVASVDRCKRIIDGILFEAQRSLPFKEYLKKSKDNSFNKEVINKAIKTIEELKYLAISQGATSIIGAATSAFRTASNGEDTISIIKTTTRIPLRIITQTDEALFAYNSAVSQYLNKNPEKDVDDIAVWDIGGGSMQVVTQTSKDGQSIYLGKLASVSFKNKLLKKINSKSHSPNPLGKNLAIDAMTMSRSYSNKHARPILKTLKNKIVLGVGGVHYFSIRKQIEAQKKVGIDSYDQNTLLNTLLERASLNDKEIGGKYAATDITNLALVLGHMQSLAIEEVIPMKINIANGLLITNSYWK